MNRALLVLVAVLALVAYAAMDRVAWLAVRGVDPWPWVRLALAVAVVFVGVVTVLINREDPAR